MKYNRILYTPARVYSHRLGICIIHRLIIRDKYKNIKYYSTLDRCGLRGARTVLQSTIPREEFDRHWPQHRRQDQQGKRSRSGGDQWR